MLPSPDVRVVVNRDRLRLNAEAIGRATGKPVLAVIKANAYGLGAAEVAAALADLVHGYYVFRPQEAVDAELRRYPGAHVIALHCGDASAESLREHRVHPVVWTTEQARRWRSAGPVLSVDTGQGRFGADVDEVPAVVAAGDLREAMTHATTAANVARFAAATAATASLTFRHAAGTALLADPAAWFDAVRPGLALYDGAVRVTTRLVDARDSLAAPAGYTQFRVQRYGLILAGYSNGFRKGRCAINGRIADVLEVGMQTSFVELDPGDVVGDEVELLGPHWTPADAAVSWNVSAQEALFRLSGMGAR